MNRYFSIFKPALLACVGTTALVAGVAHAQAGGAAAAPANTTTPNEASADRNGGLVDIVVTARRVEERVQDIPVAVTAFSGNDLVEQQVTEIRSLSGRVPNLAIVESQAEPQAAIINIRGQGAANIILATDSSVGLYVDGVNLPRTLGLRGALVDVGRVEVLRGPQGTLYGRNTTGGALSVYSQDPKRDFGGVVTGSYGNYDAFSLSGVLNIPVTEDLALRFVAQHEEHAGYGRDFNNNRIQDANSEYYRAKAKWNSGRFTATLTGDYQESHVTGQTTILAALLPGTATLPLGRSVTRQVAAELGLTPANANNPNDPAYLAAITEINKYVGGYLGNPRRSGSTQAGRSDFTGYGFSFNAEYELTDAVTLRSITGYRKFKRFNLQDFDGIPFAATYNLQTANDNFYSEEVQLLGSHDRFNWVLGGYISKEKGNEYSASTSTPRLTSNTTTIFEGDVDNRSKALFAQGTWEFLPAVKLTVGARYTWESRGLVSRNHTERVPGVVFACSIPASLLDTAGVCQATFKRKDSDPSWLASLDYKPAENVLLYAKFAQAFRAGGQNFRGSGSLDAFQAFAPETATEYELGFKTDLFDRHVRFNAAVFHTDYSDVQRQVTDSNPVTLQQFTIFTNAAKAKIDGVEVELTAQVAPGLELTANGGYINPRYKSFIDVTGNRTNEPWPAPDFTGTLGARYSVDTGAGDLTLQADYRYQSKLNLYPSSVNGRRFVTQKGYGLLNGRISMNLDDYDATISVFGRNITNKYYKAAGISLDTSGYATIIPGEPRIFGIEFRKRFGGE